MDDLKNSRRNSTIRVSSSPTGTRFVDDLMREYENHRKKRAMSEADRNVYHRHMEMVVFDLLAAWKEDATKFVGYSRGDANFARGGCYWSYKLDKGWPRKNPFKGVIDFLSEAGLTENHVAAAGAPGFSSRMRSAARLVEAFHEYGLSWVDIGTDPNADVIIVKDEKKKPILPATAKGQDGFDLDEAEANLRRINENLQSTFINLNVTDAELRVIQERLAGDHAEKELRQPFDFSHRSLKRVFALGSFEFGGRFYGGWWQGVPSEYRKFIEIDGAVTRELDFSSMQPRLMYAEVGQEAPEDAYFLPNWPHDKETRDIIKKAFNQLINSDKSSRNENQWQQRFAPDTDPMPLPKEWRTWSDHAKNEARRNAFQEFYGRSYSDLLRDLMEIHKPIGDFFFSGAWGRMQRRDSDIAEKVMLRMLNAEVPITVLPIHDSFIVRRGGERMLIRIMEEVFEEVAGRNPGLIKAGDAVYDHKQDNEPGIVVIDDGFVEQVGADIQQKKMYHQREAEWINRYGPID